MSGADFSTVELKRCLLMHAITFVPPTINPVFTEEYDDFMPLGVLALVGMLRQSNIESYVYRPRRRLFDDDAYEIVAREILSYETPVIGFSTWCNSYPSAVLLAKSIKNQDSSRVILFGGPQATILDCETLQTFEWIDFVLRGEADFTIVETVNSILEGQSFNRLEKIGGLTFRIGNGTASQVWRSKILPDIANLDELPIPAYEVVLPGADRPVSLDVGRGCPFKCTFCTTNDFFSKSYRVKSSKRIIEEIKLLRSRYGVQKFDFTHDMFTLNKKFLIPFLTEIQRFRSSCGDDFEWTCSARVDCVDGDLINRMHNAGCRGIFFGIESGSERMQKVIKKNLRISRGITVIDSCKDNNMRATSALICGFPEEERSDIDASISVAFEMAARGAKPQMSVLSVMPQTPLYEKYKDGLTLDSNISDFSGATLSERERMLIRDHPELFSSFYHLPIEGASRHTLVSLAVLINHLQDFGTTIRGLWISMGCNFEKIGWLDEFERRFERKEGLRHCELYSLVEWLEESICACPIENRGPLQSLLLAETARAVTKRIYITYQVLSPASERGALRFDDDKIDADAFVVPYWCLLEVPYNLEEIVIYGDAQWRQRQNLLESQHGVRTEFGVPTVPPLYYYLVTATNERAAEIYSVSGQQYEFMKKLVQATRSDNSISMLASWAKEAGSQLVRRLSSIGILQHHNITSELPALMLA